MTSESDLIMIAGPCSIESEDQLRIVAEAVKRCGCDYLRGGAFKPRTGAGEWTGHGKKALEWMRKIGDEYGLKIVTEILDARDIDMFKEYKVDLYQVGARNAQNQSLLEALGEAQVQVLLKNGMNTSLKEWLGSAGKVGGSDRVMLCARGKNNETDIARNGQDITTLAKLAKDHRYNVIFDPSHIAGKREFVYDITMGAIAIGVDGIIVEVHPDPVMARTDGRQSITQRQLEHLVKGACEQRELYLSQQRTRAGFAECKIPDHLDIYFKADVANGIKALIDDSPIKDFDDRDGTKIMTARIPAGLLGRFRQKGYAIGEIVPYSPKAGDSSAEGVHVTTPSGERIKLTPFSEEALIFRGRPTEKGFPGRRVEFAHGYAGQPILDAYLTVSMEKVIELIDVPLVMYKSVVEK